MPIVMTKDKMINQILSAIIFPKQGMEADIIKHHNKIMHTGKKCKVLSKLKMNYLINSAVKTIKPKGQILN